MPKASSKSRRDFLKGAALVGGAATLGGCDTTQNAGSSVGGTGLVPRYPEAHTQLPSATQRTHQRLVAFSLAEGHHTRRLELSGR